MIIGLGAFGLQAFQSPSPSVRNSNYIELSNAVFDEVHIREKADSSVDLLKTTKDSWQNDTLLLAKFLGDLEAGNLLNQGIEVVQFAIRRRRIDELNSITLGYQGFVNNSNFTFTDYTQPNDDLIYSIVPVGVNGLEGTGTEVLISSDFSGVFLVDKDTNEVLAFDQFIGSQNMFNTQLNQGEVQIDTLTKYPSFFYTPQQYHEFQIRGVFLGEELNRTGKQYQNILNKYIYTHKPFLIKASSGEVYVAKLSMPTKTAPQNTFKGYDYMDITINCKEVMSYEDYMALTE